MLNGSLSLYTKTTRNPTSPLRVTVVSGADLGGDGVGRSRGTRHGYDVNGILQKKNPKIKQERRQIRVLGTTLPPSAPTRVLSLYKFIYSGCSDFIDVLYFFTDISHEFSVFFRSNYSSRSLPIQLPALVYRVPLIVFIFL